MLNIFHECPNSIFDDVARLTHGTFALVHLLDENNNYVNNIINSKNNGDYIILDNSTYELGHSYNLERYHHWIDQINPNCFVIPEVDSKHTTQQLINYWFDNYSVSSVIGAMGVVRGNTTKEQLESFRTFYDDPRVTKIGITFDSPAYTEMYPNVTIMDAYMRGRINLIDKIDQMGYNNKPVHLLGCSLPQELKYLRKYKFINSVDTSNPVICGLKNILYSNDGVSFKPSTKLFTLIDYEVNKSEWNIIKHNIETFRKFTDDIY